MALLAVGLAVAALGAVAAGLRRRRGAATVSVTADAGGVTRVLADGRREEVTWPEVTQVDVFTARVGPHRAAGGAVVLYGDGARGCIVPLDRLAASRLLDHVHHLPAFDPAVLVAAAAGPPAATAPRALLSPRPWSHTTVCWRREDT